MSVAGVTGVILPDRNEAPEVHTKAKKDPAVTIRTVQWHGSKDIRVKDLPKPQITDPGDALIRITSDAICGSDLHMYVGQMPGMKAGDVVGHENMGIVEEVGPKVRSLKAGDRVVVSFDIACGHCVYCKKQEFTACDSTNPSKEQEMLYGHHTGGLFGYSALTGGYDGGQAEYLRVPLADNNTLKVPDEKTLPDDKVLFLSDILPTAWHANELAEVKTGDNVAIWGCGPVGILAAHCAQVRGAARVVLVDSQADRLQFARSKFPGVETVNCKERDTLSQLKDMFKDEHGRYIGPDAVIEAVGFHYTSKWTHWVQMALKLETDPPSTLNELIEAVRKGGRIGIVGVYAGTTNGFKIGAFMEKGLSMRAGQTPVQKYWHHLLDLIKKGTLHPELVITHHLPLDEAPRGYQMFNDKQEGCIKVVLRPGAAAPAGAVAQGSKSAAE